MPGTLGAALLIIYLLVKDVTIPLVKKLLRKNRLMDPEDRPLGSLEKRIEVLEINLSNERVRLADFAEMLKDQARASEQASIITDQKLDRVLAELKEIREEFERRYAGFGERLRGVEVHIEHLLKGKRAGL